MASPAPAKPGLQAERTVLSWERSATGFLFCGVLLLLRHSGPLAAGRAAVGIATLVLALAVVVLGRTRARRIRTPQLAAGRLTVGSPRTEVLLVGLATAALATAVVVLG